MLASSSSVNFTNSSLRGPLDRLQQGMETSGGWRKTRKWQCDADFPKHLLRMLAVCTTRALSSMLSYPCPQTEAGEP